MTRVDHHAGLGLLHLGDLARLLGDGEVLVHDAQAAVARHADGRAASVTVSIADEMIGLASAIVGVRRSSSSTSFPRSRSTSAAASPTSSAPGQDDHVDVVRRDHQQPDDAVRVVALLDGGRHRPAGGRSRSSPPSEGLLAPVLVEEGRLQRLGVGTT